VSTTRAFLRVHLYSFILATIVEGGRPSADVGEVEVIGGVKCYVGTPSGECPKEKAILFLTDVFGIQLINSQV